MYRCFKKIISLLFCCIVFVYGDSLEDSKIFEALSFIDMGDYESAIDIYNNLYATTNKLEYLEEVIKLSMNIGDIDNALRYIQTYQNIDDKNLNVKYILASIYMMQQDVDNAIIAYEDIIALEKDDTLNKINFKALGGLYTIKKDYQKAQKYLMQSYAIQKDSHTLLFIVSTDISIDDFAHSVPLIEDYYKEEIDDDFAQVITQLSFDNKNLDDVESLFEDYFDNHPNSINANNLYRVYILNDDLDSALSLANEYDLNLEYIVDKYLLAKDYKKAREVLKQIMEKRDDSYYYGVMAIIDFEEAEDKKSVLDSVIEKFKIALKDDNPTFANYLGYLLIDYDIDINEGMKYVESALEQEPNNPAYLDSLAWGYYKLDDCQSAMEIMNKINKEDINSEEELKRHLEYIRKCLKE